MRKNLSKKVCLFTAVAMLSTSVVACGGKAVDATTAVATDAAEVPTTIAATTEELEETVAEMAEMAEVADGALTEDEYLTKVEELGTSMTDTVTNSQTQLSSLDPTDVEGAAKVIEDMKAPFVDFAAITAPEAYTDAQAKFKTGCEAMIEYLDICLEMMSMGDKVPTAEETQELTTRLTTALTTVQTDFTDASALLIEGAAN